MKPALQVVVAEDNDTDILLITKHLARGGLQCTVHRTQTEAEFVDALERVHPDVIISDFTMPQFDGSRALTLALTRAPATPFLFVSGTIGEERAVETLKQGATDYVLKNNLARLAPAVQRAVHEAELKEAQRRAEQHLRDTVETSQDWIWEVDSIGEFTFCSAGVTAILGYLPADLLGKDYRAYLNDTDREQADALLPFPGHSQLTGAVARWRAVDGQTRWLERNVVVVRDDHQRITGYRGTDRDVTARRDQEARLRRLTRTYRMLSSVSSAHLRSRTREDLLNEVCRIAVRTGGYERVTIGLMEPNAAAVRLQAWAASNTRTSLSMDRLQLDTELGAASMAARTIRSRSPTICNDLNTERTPVANREALLTDGYEALATLPILVDGTVIGVITLFSELSGIFDETEVEALQELAANLGFALQFLEKDEAVNFLSYFDTLTGLAKRPLFCQRLAQAIAVRSVQTEGLQVAVFDIQQLRIINDSFGRYVGDQLIEAMAARLKDAHPDTQKLAYLGGGTFAMALPNAGSTAELETTLQQTIGRLFAEPFNIDGHAIRPLLRYGVAGYSASVSLAEILVQHAEGSLAAAREDNERYVVHGSMTRRPTSREYALESRLAGALERDEFLLHYQPKVCLTTGNIEGLEALLRWKDSQEGLVPPSTFIPWLERSGSIVDVGGWALLQAARDIHLWREADAPEFRVAVNVSAIQLRRGDFVTQVLHCVRSSGVLIDIELTESMLMQDIDLSTRKLAELREAGVGVAIDDFGTGYSSLRLLSGLPVNALKIDRSFVQSAAESASGKTLVSTVIALAQGFGMRTIAEGVETRQQLDMLRTMGCNEAQGYFFARPTPASEVPSVIARLSREAGDCIEDQGTDAAA